MLARLPTNGWGDSASLCSIKSRHLNISIAAASRVNPSLCGNHRQLARLKQHVESLLPQCLHRRVLIEGELPYLLAHGRIEIPPICLPRLALAGT